MFFPVVLTNLSMSFSLAIHAPDLMPARRYRVIILSQTGKTVPVVLIVQLRDIVFFMVNEGDVQNAEEAKSYGSIHAKERWAGLCSVEGGG
jgi:fructoselysine-6-P-deglycase FrlB-like protein